PCVVDFGVVTRVNVCGDGLRVGGFGDPLCVVGLGVVTCVDGCNDV
ncbi:unnamed protein product, partial [Rotaria sp. Silwood1]